MSKTIDYYNELANDYYASTVEADMSAQYSMFEKYLGEGARVLDCGCGSGRDSKHFIEQGFAVEAIDGSANLCKLASELTGLGVKNILFQDMDYVGCFDGIWACASLLHLSKEELLEVLTKLKRALVDGGILYVSFKYGNFEGERNGRFFIDLNEDSLSTLMAEIGGFEIKEKYISSDVRSGRDNEKWLNVILIKLENAREETNTGLVEEGKTSECEIVVDDSERKILKIYDGMKDINFNGILANLVQLIDIGKAVGEVEKKIEYVVRIPAKYREQFETGEVFINKNLKSGVEWPTLMKRTEDGRKRFVDNLPIQQKEFVQNNPFHDICKDFNNIYIQQQLQSISESLKEIEEKVQLVIKGQQDDRVAHIEAGRKEIMLGLSCNDENAKQIHIENGRKLLILGWSQLEKELETRVAAFKPISSNKALILAREAFSMTGSYCDKKDDEYGEIDNCYELYHRATYMLAMSWAITGELDALQNTFNESISFMKNLDTSSIKTIEHIHGRSDLSEEFYNYAIEDLKKEMKICLEVAEDYDYLEIEVVGDKLLEVIKDGKAK